MNVRDFNPIIGRITVFFALAIMLMSINICLYSQQTNYSGIWLLKRVNKFEGPQGAEAVIGRHVIVAQSPDRIIIKRHASDRQSKDSFISDSVELNTAASISYTPQKRKRVAQIESNDRYFIETIRFYSAENYNQLEFTNQENWSMSANKDSLTILKSCKYQIDSGDNWLVQGIYVRINDKQLYEDTAKNEGVSFMQSSWEQVKRKAKEENKMIFVDCYASWCGPCKEMDRSVYVINKVGTAVNPYFVSLKLQMDSTKKDNEQVRSMYTTVNEFTRKFRIAGYPAFLFFSSDGSLLHSDIGFKNIDEFINTINDAKDPDQQLHTQVNNYRKGVKNYPKMLNLILRLDEAGDSSMANQMAVDYKYNYLDRLNSDEPFLNEKIITFANNHKNIFHTRDRFFDICYNRPKKINHILPTPDIASYWVNEIILTDEILSKVFKSGKPVKTEPDWQAIASAAHQNFGKANTDSIVLESRIIYYWLKNEKNKCPDIISKKVHKYGLKQLGFSWDNLISDIYLPYCQNKNSLNEALSWMNELIRDEKVPETRYGCFSGILYKLGRKSEAIDYMNKSIAFYFKGRTESSLLTDDLYKLKRKLIQRMNNGEVINEKWQSKWFY
jgi:thioredoxin-related protein